MLDRRRQVAEAVEQTRVRAKSGSAGRSRCSNHSQRLVDEAAAPGRSRARRRRPAGELDQERGSPASPPLRSSPALRVSSSDSPATASWTTARRPSREPWPTRRGTPGEVRAAPRRSRRSTSASRSSPGSASGTRANLTAFAGCLRPASKARPTALLMLRWPVGQQQQRAGGGQRRLAPSSPPPGAARRRRSAPAARRCAAGTRGGAGPTPASERGARCRQQVVGRLLDFERQPELRQAMRQRPRPVGAHVGVAGGFGAAPGPADATRPRQPPVGEQLGVGQEKAPVHPPQQRVAPGLGQSLDRRGPYRPAARGRCR